METHEHPTIEALAYCIYLADGRPEGRALQHWLEARELVEAEALIEAESSFDSNIFNAWIGEEPERAGRTLIASSNLG